MANEITAPITIIQTTITAPITQGPVGPQGPQGIQGPPGDPTIYKNFAVAMAVVLG